MAIPGSRILPVSHPLRDKARGTLGRTRESDSQLSFRKLRGPVVKRTDLQVGIVLVGKGLVGGLLHLLAVSLELLLVNGNLGGSEGNSGNEFLKDSRSISIGPCSN